MCQIVLCYRILLHNHSFERKLMSLSGNFVVWHWRRWSKAKDKRSRVGWIKKLWETFLLAEIVFSCFWFALLSSFTNFWMDQFFWEGKTVPLLSKTSKQCSKRWWWSWWWQHLVVGERPKKKYKICGNPCDPPSPLNFTITFWKFLDGLNHTMYVT